MTSPNIPLESGELREQLSRLIIENQSDDGSIDISDQVAMRDEILVLFAKRERAARLDELQHITVCELDDELGAWYEPNEGYQQTITDRIKNLEQGEK